MHCGKIEENINLKVQSLMISMNVRLLQIEKTTLEFQLKKEFLINKWYKQIYLQKVEEERENTQEVQDIDQILKNYQNDEKISSQPFLNSLFENLVTTSQHKINSNFKVKIQEQQDSIFDEDNIRIRRAKAKNDTKNIPKNFGKAIINFVQKNQKIVNQVLKKYNFKYEEYISAILEKKNHICTIIGLRSIWIEKQFKFAKVTRILSMLFLKRHSLKYIFRSRISNYQGHIKYRNRIIDRLYCPQQFTRIKIY